MKMKLWNVRRWASSLQRMVRPLAVSDVLMLLAEGPTAAEVETMVVPPELRQPVSRPHRRTDAEVLLGAPSTSFPVPPSRRSDCPSASKGQLSSAAAPAIDALGFRRAARELFGRIVQGLGLPYWCDVKRPNESSSATRPKGDSE